ncbi:MAG: hypothetical protein ACRDRJ_33060, partial [Streptosporangiaceae bacterium]
HYHRQDFHAIAAAVNAVHRRARRRALNGEEADEFMHGLLKATELTEAERMTAWLLLSEDCGINVYRHPGDRRWTYHDGRHRARALMDARVRRILVTITDESRGRHP